MPIVGVSAIALLASIGTAQWLVLRHLIMRSWIWILTTAGAWAAGLVVFTAVSTPRKPGQPAAEIAIIGMLGGLAMAATVAAITGWSMGRLLRRQRTQAAEAR